MTKENHDRIAMTKENHERIAMAKENHAAWYAVINEIKPTVKISMKISCFLIVWGHYPAFSTCKTDKM
jgi:hypothetical protein